MATREKKPAWVTRTWVDASGKRRRERAKPGSSWVKDSAEFLVETFDRRTGKRSQERIEGTGREAKKAADKRAAELNDAMRTGNYAAPATWAEARKTFERDALAIGRKESTIKDVKWSLDRFEAVAKPGRLDKVTTHTIDQFIAARMAADPKPSPSYVNHDLRNVRLFLRKLKTWKMIADVPHFPMLEEAEPDKPLYTPDEFLKMYEAAGAAERPKHLSPAARKLWWQAAMLLYWESGCRRDEALAIDWEGVSLDERRAVLRASDAKAGKSRFLYFGAETAAHLQDLAATLFPGATATGPVFVFPLDSSALNIELAKIQAAAGIEKRADLAFHAFRRTCGTSVAVLHGLEGARLRLGHSSIAITQRHYAGKAVAALAAAAAPATPAIRREALRVVG